MASASTVDGTVPVDGLSLFGFLPKAVALGYLASECTGMGSIDRKQAYQAAVAKLGAPFPKAGHPDILPIPAAHQAHLVAVTQDQQFARTVFGFNAFDWGLVEIDPLIAFQLHVSIERAGQRSQADVSVGAMLPLCLPVAPMTVNATWTLGGGPMLGSVTLVSDSLNLTALGPPNLPANGLVNPAAEVGPILGVASDLVHVFEVGGRYYLRNGYHRAYALSEAGASHMPALILRASTYAQAQVPVQGFFAPAMLQGRHPPTMGHFTQGRAYPVKLKRARRRVRISWKIDAERA